MKSFSNETLNFFFRKFCFSYILDWILPKLYELCESCRRKLLETRRLFTRDLRDYLSATRK